MTIRPGRLDLLAADETLLIEGLAVEGGSDLSDELSDAGAGRVTVIPDDGVDASDDGFRTVDTGQLVRLVLNPGASETVQLTGLVEVAQKTVLARVPSERRAVLTVRDWLAEFDQAPISPPFGADSLPAAVEIASDWTHPAVDTSAWGNAVYLGPAFGGDVDQFGNPVSGGLGAKNGVSPDGAPDSFVGWIAASAVDGNGSHPVDDVHYLHLDLTCSAGLLIGAMTGDDSWAWAFDGALFEEGVADPAIQWQSMYSLGLPAVTAGSHVFRARGTNFANPANPTNVYNPMAFCATFYQADASVWLEWGNVIARTGSDPSSADPLLGGGWKALRNPAAPPGLTWGRFYRAAFDVTQDEGFLAGWTLGFTDTLDSAGNPWAVRDDMVMRVNDTHLKFFTQSAAAGWADVAARPADRVLDAWRPGERGDYWTSPGSPPAWGAGQVSQLDVTRRLR